MYVATKRFIPKIPGNNSDFTWAAGMMIVNCIKDQFQMHKTAKHKILSVFTFGSWKL